MGRIATLSVFRWRELCKQLVCGLMNGFEMVCSGVALVTLGRARLRPPSSPLHTQMRSWPRVMGLKYIVPSAHAGARWSFFLYFRSK